MTCYKLEVQDSITWRGRPWGGTVDGVPVTFPNRKAALDYWHDSAPGRNDRCRVVQVQP
jgi:hypothetical protein